ncbi:MAG: ABC transporter permease [Spirochaetales bacterium]|nr:ABC transporter permease [Spirochaetales bacterium]
MSDLLSYILTAEFGYSMLRVTTPILFAAMGSIVAESSGASNIALEGNMLFAALFGAIGSGLTGSVFWGLIIAIAGGLIISALLIYFGLYLKTDIILSGIALNTLASGGSIFLMYVILHDKGSTSSIKTLVCPNINLPGIENIPVLGDILSGHNILTYFAFLSVIFVWFLLYKTKLGMHIRCVGENAEAAASVGIKIKSVKLVSLLISGVLASLGGAFLSMGYMNGFSRGMVSGRGFIGLAAAAMGQLSPVPTLIASLIFGCADAMSNIMAAMRIPDEFVKLIPYVTTVVGLIVISSWRTWRVKKKRIAALVSAN